MATVDGITPTGVDTKIEAARSAGTAVDQNARDAAEDAQITADGKYAKPGTGIPLADLDAATQGKISSPVDSAARTTAGAAYVKPSTGIPAADLTTAVQANITAAGTAVQPAALAAKADKSYVDTQDGLSEKTANRNAVNGYAGLDGSGRVAAAQLPAYVDDVLDFANVASFPTVGEAGKIYIADDASNKTYRWNTGTSTYIEISPSPGSTDGVAEGSVNLYFSNGRALAALGTDAATGRTNLGLGSASQQPSSAFDPSGAAAAAVLPVARIETDRITARNAVAGISTGTSMNTGTFGTPVRYQDAYRKKIIVQNKSAVTLQIGYAATNSVSPPSWGTTQSVAPGQEWVGDPGRGDPVWFRDSGGTTVLVNYSTEIGV